MKGLYALSSCLITMLVLWSGSGSLASAAVSTPKVSGTPGPLPHAVTSKEPTVVSGWTEVWTTTQLQYIDQHQQQYLNSNIKLMHDVDLSSYNWVPFGGNAYNSNHPYSGIFDGQGYEITRLNVTDSTDSNVGLFGETSGTIENLGVWAYISSSHGSSAVGALAGRSTGTIQNCWSIGQITAKNDWSGGLVGIDQGVITSSFSHAEVSDSGGGTVGGLVGELDGTSGQLTVSQSYATGNVSGNLAGGLIGVQNGGTIADTFASGSITGVNSQPTVGGLVGQQGDLISNSYATGTVSASTPSFLGGFVGTQTADISSSYFESHTSKSVKGVGHWVSGSGTPSIKTTDAMKTASTFTTWDFTKIWGIDQTHNGGYPYLLALASSYPPPYIPLTYGVSIEAGNGENIPGNSTLNLVLAFSGAPPSIAPDLTIRGTLNGWSANPVQQIPVTFTVYGHSVTKYVRFPGFSMNPGSGEQTLSVKVPSTGGNTYSNVQVHVDAPVISGQAQYFAFTSPADLPRYNILDFDNMPVKYSPTGNADVTLNIGKGGLQDELPEVPMSGLLPLMGILGALGVAYAARRKRKNKTV